MPRFASRCSARPPRFLWTAPAGAHSNDGVKAESHDVVIVGGGLVGSLLATLLVGTAESELYYAKGASQKRVSRIDQKAADRWAWKVEDVEETGETAETP